MAETAAEKKAREEQEAADAAAAEAAKNQGTTPETKVSTTDDRTASKGGGSEQDQVEAATNKDGRQLFKVAPGSSMVGAMPEGTVFDPLDTNKVFLGNTDEEKAAAFQRLYDLGAIVPADAEDVKRYDMPLGDRDPLLATGTPVQTQRDLGARIMMSQSGKIAGATDTAGTRPDAAGAAHTAPLKTGR